MASAESSLTASSGRRLGLAWRADRVRAEKAPAGASSCPASASSSPCCSAAALWPRRPPIGFAIRAETSFLANRPHTIPATQKKGAARRRLTRLGRHQPEPHIHASSPSKLRLLSRTEMKPRLERASGSALGDLGAGADLAALQHGVDFTLGLRLLEAVLGRDLSHEVGLALERGDLLLGEMAPLGTDVLARPSICSARECWILPKLPKYRSRMNFPSGILHIL